MSVGVEPGVNESQYDAVGVTVVDTVAESRVDTDEECELKGEPLILADCDVEAVFEIDGVRDGETLSVPLIPVDEDMTVPEKDTLPDTRGVTDALFEVTPVPEAAADHDGVTLGKTLAYALKVANGSLAVGVAIGVILDVSDFIDNAVVNALTEADLDTSGERESNGVCDDVDETAALSLTLTDPLYEEKIESVGKGVREDILD